MHPYMLTVAIAASMAFSPAAAQTPLDREMVAAIDAANSPDDVRAAIENIELPATLEALLIAADSLDYAGPIIEKLETDARARIMAGMYRACDVFFAEVGGVFSEAVSDDSYLIMTVSDHNEADDTLRTVKEFDHDVLTLTSLVNSGLTEMVELYASQNILRIDGRLRVSDAKILSDTDKYQRATFLMLKDVGIVYMRGIGQIISPGAGVTELTGRDCP